MGEARETPSNVSPAAHVVVFLAGLGWLCWLTTPVSYDGLINTDSFAMVLLLAAGLFLAAVGGAVEGALARRGPPLLARAMLIAFALVAVWPPALMSGQWFESSDSGGSSSSLGLALVAWTATVGLEYRWARLINRQGDRSRKAAADPPE